MNPHETQIWNAAINAALAEYHSGYGAIRRLKRTFSVTVEHIGTTTRQDVTEVRDEETS